MQCWCMCTHIQVWQCFDENLNLEDCDTACYGSSCQNTDCSQSILIPST